MITPELVRDFWAFMQAEFGSSVEQKATSDTMQVAAALLDALDIQDRDQFMRDFVTTLHRTIYIPFEIGVEGADGRWSLWGQIRVCVHEHTHVVQGEREGWVTFDARYLTSSSWRAGYEAEAYGSDLEMEFWRTEDILDIDRRVESLKNYGCSAEDIDQAKATLELRAGLVAQGVVETRAAAVAIAWLETHAPELRDVT